MYTLEQRKKAVETFFQFDCSYANTIMEFGYPSKQLFVSWIDELAPGERRLRPKTQIKYDIPLEEKIEIVAELESRSGTAAEIAEKHNVSRTIPYV